MTDAEIMQRARDLCDRDIKSLLFIAGRKTVTVLACIVGFGLAMTSQYVQFSSATALDLVPNIVLSVTVPILYSIPLVWLIFRFIVRNPHEKA